MERLEHTNLSSDRTGPNAPFMRGIECTIVSEEERRHGFGFSGELTPLGELVGRPEGREARFFLAG